jgi:RimJ/RimL family protein N-acetyltransferase
MPSREEHARFVASYPYRCWFLIEEVASRTFVGACYLTQMNEVGVAVLKEFQRRGLARAALLELLHAHQPLPAIPGQRRGRFVANVAPRNAASRKFFESLGAVVVQHTYEIPPPSGASG